jgi:hypothetical protein
MPVSIGKPLHRPSTHRGIKLNPRITLLNRRIAATRNDRTEASSGCQAYAPAKRSGPNRAGAKNKSARLGNGALGGGNGRERPFIQIQHDPVAPVPDRMGFNRMPCLRTAVNSGNNVCG